MTVSCRHDRRDGDGLACLSLNTYTTLVVVTDPLECACDAEDARAEQQRQ